MSIRAAKGSFIVFNYYIKMPTIPAKLHIEFSVPFISTAQKQLVNGWYWSL